MAIKALVFDFDGLILDTELPDYRSWQDIFDEYGCALPLSAWAQGIGAHAHAFDAHQYLEHQLQRTLDRETLAIDRRRRFHSMVAGVAIQPGVESLISAGLALGLKIGCASSSSRVWVNGHLDRLGLLHFFECVCCQEDVVNVKPDPAVYRCALAALGVEPHEAIAFEDSPNGVAAACEAGIFCVAVPNALTSRLPLDKADLRVWSLADIALTALISTAEASVSDRSVQGVAEK